MNRTKTILAAVGGVAAVAVLAAGYFAWSQQSAKTAALEGDEDGAIGLETVREKAERLSRKPVYPGAESVKALEEAREALTAWKDEAFALASRGDRKIEPKTGAAFKEFVVADARRLQSLPAGKDAKTLDPAFDFGLFKPYVSEDKTPEEAAVGELQRKWDDMATIIETLSANGIESVSSVAVRAPAQPQQEEEAKPKKGKAKAKAKARAKAKAAEPVAVQPSSFTYVVACKARPASLVRALNAMATCERFLSVEDLALQREKDAVAEGLGAEEKKDEPAPAVSRRRRRGAEEESAEKAEEKPAEAPLYTVVTDPTAEQPLDVRLTVAVYDFRTFDEKKEGEVEK